MTTACSKDASRSQIEHARPPPRPAPHATRTRRRSSAGKNPPQQELHSAPTADNTYSLLPMASLRNHIAARLAAPPRRRIPRSSAPRCRAAARHRIARRRVRRERRGLLDSRRRPPHTTRSLRPPTAGPRLAAVARPQSGSLPAPVNRSTYPSGPAGHGIRRSAHKVNHPLAPSSKLQCSTPP